MHALIRLMPRHGPEYKICVLGTGGVGTHEIPVLLAVSEPADAVTGLINSGKFAFTIMFMQGQFGQMRCLLTSHNLNGHR
jgi:hypothetical protein